MSEAKLHFIIIDDSKLDCFIAEKIIQNTGMSESVRSFQLATEALAYIKERPEGGEKTILLVDIQMPIMNGFEFVEAFENTLTKEVKDRYVVNLLSSSINESDMIKAKSYSSIQKFVNKPLTKASLMNVVEEAG